MKYFANNADYFESLKASYPPPHPAIPIAKEAAAIERTAVLSPIRAALSLAETATAEECAATIEMWDKSIRTLIGIMKQRDELEAENLRLRKALAPFRRWHSTWTSQPPDDRPLWEQFPDGPTFGDFRRLMEAGK